MQYATAIANAVAFSNHARIVCPACSHERKKDFDRCMNVDRKDNGSIVFYCWHCAHSGCLGSSSRRHNSERTFMYATDVDPFPVLAIASIAPKLQPLDIAYLQSRGISEATALASGIYSTRRNFGDTELSCIAMPYRNAKGQTVGAKYRTDAKNFTQDKGGVHVFYGIDRVVEGKPLIMCEGEIDQLSLTEVGLANALSVPSGAPIRISNGRADASEDRRFACVGDARAIIDKAEKVILATDNDAPGMALREELSRRVGKHKCWIVTYPDGCKDANDVLVKHGPVALQEVIDKAMPYPIMGLFSADTYTEEVTSLYAKKDGRGLSTGLLSLDQFYTIAPCQLTVVTGLPSHGKSNLVDQLTVNLAQRLSWKTVYCSFENPPAVHIARLMEILLGKPFFDNSRGIPRLTEEDRAQAMAWINQHFTFIDFRDTELPTIDAILSKAQAAVQRLGVRGLVIDPYNFIRMERRGTETDEISEMLSKVQAFNKANEMHTWFVAHPHKIYSEEGRPGGMHVAGSASWFAKADCGLTVHRGKHDLVFVDVWKCRYRWIGKQGTAQLRYLPTAGTYEDMPRVVGDDDPF